MKAAEYFYAHYPSPVGRLTLIADDDGLSAVLWENDRPGRVEIHQLRENENHPVLTLARRQLDQYFAGTRVAFDVPIDLEQGTDFQKAVWSALRNIPYGETRSYGEIAQSIGVPKSARAVGGANNRNPLPIIVPCHRVIGASGGLTGYAGGVDIKARLLALEGGFHRRMAA
jgi:methylated-DNA-[protein]-cysteine S-methyltransferase